MEMTNVQFLIAKNDMCSRFGLHYHCKDCPIKKLGEEKQETYSCPTIIRLYPDEVTTIINNWAAQHMTYLADFRKKCPDALFRVSSLQPEPIPVACRKNIYGTSISECKYNNGPCKQCWEEIYI